MHNAETEPKFIFDDFSASKPKQPATETRWETNYRNRLQPAHHNLNNQQLKLKKLEMCNTVLEPAHHNLNNQHIIA